MQACYALPGCGGAAPACLTRHGLPPALPPVRCSIATTLTSSTAPKQVRAVAAVCGSGGSWQLQRSACQPQLLMPSLLGAAAAGFQTVVAVPCLDCCLHPAAPWLAVILSTNSWVGGRNNFLGACYIAVGGICLLTALFFFLGYDIGERLVGLMFRLCAQFDPSCSGVNWAAAVLRLCPRHMLHAPHRLLPACPTSTP